MPVMKCIILWWYGNTDPLGKRGHKPGINIGLRELLTNNKFTPLQVLIHFNPKVLQSELATFNEIRVLWDFGLNWKGSINEERITVAEYLRYWINCLLYTSDAADE